MLSSIGDLLLCLFGLKGFFSKALSATQPGNSLRCGTGGERLHFILSMKYSIKRFAFEQMDFILWYNCVKCAVSLDDLACSLAPPYTHMLQCARM